MNKHKALWIGLGVLGLLGVCCVVGIAVLVMTLPSFDDCPTGWSGTAQAWLDENANGVQDTGERPLPGVTFTIEGAAGKPPVTSDAQGSAWVGLSFECSAAFPSAAMLRAQAPPGYRATTPERLPVRRETHTLAFGFTYQPGVPTATPYPAMTCTSYTGTSLGGEAYVTDLDLAPDGAVWLTIFQGGLVKFSAQHGVLAIYKNEASGLPLDTTGVAVAPDGTLWAWAGPPGRLGRFDGSTWTSYPPPTELKNTDFEADIAVAPDGSVWLGSTTPDYLGRFIPGTETWETYPLGKGVANWATAFAAAPDNSLWLTDQNGSLLHFTPPATAGGQPTWRTYPHMHFYGSMSQTLAIAQDGTIWVLSDTGVKRLDPVADQWTDYPDLTGRRTIGIAIAPDQTVWVATTEGMLHMVPAPDAADPPAMTFYGTVDGLLSNEAEDFLVAPDGSLWVGFVRGLSHCVVAP
jgi:streptogramin lyase